MTEGHQATSLAAEVTAGVETPLHYFLQKSSGDSEPGVVIREAALKGHLNLRGNPNNEEFAESVATVLGIPLPTEPGTSSRSDETAVYWLGPTEWLVIVDGGREALLETQLRQTLHGHFSIVDISGGQTLINLSGKGVYNLLAQSSSYDFHPAHFGPGRCVQTTFAKATALISKKPNGSFDLVIRRSFADYLASWLLDAGKEFGCRIERA